MSMAAKPPTTAANSNTLRRVEYAIAAGSTAMAVVVDDIGSGAWGKPGTRPHTGRNAGARQSNPVLRLRRVGLAQALQHEQVLALAGLELGRRGNPGEGV